MHVASDPPVEVVTLLSPLKGGTPKKQRTLSERVSGLSVRGDTPLSLEGRSSPLYKGGPSSRARQID